MKLGKYIQLLLPEHETVIIPGFGAFVSTYKPAQIDKESGEIKPPSKEISFNQKIRNNDGLLVGVIAEKEGISHFEALKKIETERENILYRLDKGEKVTLEKTGELQYDEQHNIQFNPFKGENLLPDAYGLETAYTIKEIQEKGEDEPDADYEDKKLKKFITAVNQQPAEKETVKKDPPSEGVKEPEPVMAEKQEEKKNRGWLWFLLILLPLIVAGIFMIRKNNEETMPVTEVNETPVITDTTPDEAEPVPAHSDSIGSDTVKLAVAEDSVKSSQQDTTAGTSEDSVNIKIGEPADSAKYVEPDPSKYYLVAGSFKEKENADEFFAKLEKEGFEPFHLGKQGNFYIVGLGEYEREWQAFRAQDDFLETHPESGVWVYQVE